jgi:hypothetical protein
MTILDEKISVLILNRMKKVIKNRYSGTKFQAVPKHPETFTFHVNSSENTSIPAYHSSGLKTYVRTLPPVRNQRLIAIMALYNCLTEIVPQNDVSVHPEGLVINGKTVEILEGLAVISGKIKFRFVDLLELLETLRQEGVLICRKQDLFSIRKSYFQILSEK